VLYLPADPTDAKIESFLELHFAALFLAIVGSIFLVCGIGFMIANP
jgi:hypothetical protein